ncbi:MAG: hypothetical protein AAF543_09450 [Pseudomonadota bacterium]
MSVMTASRRVTRAMRDAIKETISPANQGSERTTSSRSFSESHQFGQELHKRLNAYTGAIDEFGCPGNTVDNWRVEFSRKEGAFEAANSASKDDKA